MPTAYITAPTEKAKEIAQTVVEERLVACVNLIDIRSVYRWDGEIVEDDEVALIAKTTGERYDELERRVAELHPYDVPCIERIDEAAVFEQYEQWVVGETTENR